MDLRSIEQRNPTGLTAAEDQRQFSPAENHCLNLMLLLHAFDDSQQSLARLRQEHTLQQLAQVLVVDVILLILRRHDQRDSLPGKYLRIEACLHGEAGPEQSGFTDPALLSLCACCLDDADQRDGRALLNFIEHNMRGIGGNYAEVRAGS